MSEDLTPRLNAALEGRYTVERKLGEGGMATVYLAQDLKHNRSVALKVLKPELAALVGAERFLTEIEVTANLQHPHILPLFDSGEADSFLFYVMPFIEGETLRARLDRERQLPVDEAVRIATAVANALDYAHGHGVIHRDIKPANILLQAGEPVVADFGIALAVGAAGGARLTETGLSVGTPFYMSPEQATGDQIVGPTSDTYALGCVLYEMLVGVPPYSGATAQAILGKIISGAPVLPTQERPSIPAHVDAAIRRALEKLPADRFMAARDFAKALAEPGFRHGAGAVAAASGEEMGRWRRLALGASTLAAGLALVTGWTLLRPNPPGPPEPVGRFSLAETSAQLRSFSLFDMSGDGSALVYTGPSDDAPSQLWVRRWDNLAAVPIPGTDDAFSLDISPDGSEVAFVQGNVLTVVPLQGGVSRTLADSVFCCPGWAPDGWVYFTTLENDLARVPENGGAIEVLVRLNEDGSESFIAEFQLLPGGEVGVYSRWASASDGAHVIEALRLATGERTPLTTGLKPYYVEPGYLVFASDEGQILAAPFDADAVELTGTPIPLVDGVVLVANDYPVYSVSGSGALVYLSGGTTNELEPVWVERSGLVQEIDPDWRFTGTSTNSSLALSPDGTRLAVSIQGPPWDIWIKQLDTGPLSKLTFFGATNRRPAWTLDGRSVAFVSNRSQNEAGAVDLWTKRADGSSAAELVLDEERSIFEVAYSPDGQWLLYRAGTSTGGGNPDLYAIRPGTDSVATPLATSEFWEMMPTVSPDGRWLAYESNESGRLEVYVRPFPDAASARWQVSANGGREPLWAHSGRELFYRNAANELVAAEVGGDVTFIMGQQTVLFSMEGFLPDNGHPMYDVAPDDQRFVMLRRSVFGETDLVLVQNWIEEVEARVGN